MRASGLRNALIAAVIGFTAVSPTITAAQATTVVAHPSARSAAVRPTAATAFFCTDTALGGAFYCDGSSASGEAWYQFPNGLKQLFVVGSDNAVWTRWQESNGSYHAWYSMGGYSLSYPVVVNGSGYSPQINVVGQDGTYWWYRVRDSLTATWSAWACCA
jgi:hypothetical protein